MERQIYDRMAELADVHWWYVARRRILADLIRREVKPPAKARILEIGCGTGHNLGMLAKFGAVDGLEVDDEARVLAERRHGKAILSAPLPGLTGVRRRTYDLIAALDVVEHVDDDAAAIGAIAERLKPGGKILLRSPNYNSANRFIMGAEWCGFRFPDHVNYFTPRSLGALAASIGYEFHWMNWMSLFDDNLIVELKKPSAAAVEAPATVDAAA